MAKSRKRIAIPPHPKPAVEAALTLAREAEWLSDYPRAHWGIIYCPYGHSECRMSVNNTPKVPESHARDIRKIVKRCRGADELD